MRGNATTACPRAPPLLSSWYANVSCRCHSILSSQNLPLCHALCRGALYVWRCIPTLKTTPAIHSQSNALRLLIVEPLVSFRKEKKNQPNRKCKLLHIPLPEAIFLFTCSFYLLWTASCVPACAITAKNSCCREQGRVVGKPPSTYVNEWGNLSGGDLLQAAMAMDKEQASGAMNARKPRARNKFPFFVVCAVLFADVRYPNPAQNRKRHTNKGYCNRDRWGLALCTRYKTFGTESWTLRGKGRAKRVWTKVRLLWESHGQWSECKSHEIDPATLKLPICIQKAAIYWGK